jgi:hypothetical protein
MIHLGLPLRVLRNMKITQLRRVAMEIVVSREHANDRTLSRQGPECAESFRILVGLRNASAVKLRPPRLVVTESFSRGCPRRDGIDPLIDRSVCLPDSAQPLAVGRSTRGHWCRAHRCV